MPQLVEALLSSRSHKEIEALLQQTQNLLNDTDNDDSSIRDSVLLDKLRRRLFPEEPDNDEDPTNAARMLHSPRKGDLLHQRSMQVLQSSHGKKGCQSVAHLSFQDLEHDGSRILKSSQPPVFVDTPSSLAALREECSKVRLVAIDTEWYEDANNPCQSIFITVFIYFN